MERGLLVYIKGRRVSIRLPVNLIVRRMDAMTGMARDKVEPRRADCQSCASSSKRLAKAIFLIVKAPQVPLH